MRLPRKLVLPVMVAALGTGALAGCTSLDHWERRAIFQNEAALHVDRRDVPDDAIEFDLDVPGGGVTGQDKVHVWYLAAAQPAAAMAPTVLYLHGARHNLYGNASRIERLHELGYNVLALDYRGFGRSTSILPSESTAIEDARLAYAELARRQPDAARRIVYGYSLGGAVAIALAREIDGIAGVVVESSFTSIPDVVRTMRWGWLPLVRMAVTQDFDSERRIAAVTKPLLFLHGTADSIVPHTMSDRLYAAAGQVPEQYKRIIKIDGASHRGALSMAVSDYGDALGQFAQLAAARVNVRVNGLDTDIAGPVSKGASVAVMQPVTAGAVAGASTGAVTGAAAAAPTAAPLLH